METTCPCCTADDNRLLYAKKDYPHILRGLPETYTIRQCDVCGSAFSYPMPTDEDLLDLYKNDFEYSDAFTQAERDGLNRYLDMIQGLLPTKDISLLDAGCASGFLLAVAQERGWRTYGLDTTESLLQKAAARVPDAELYLGKVEDSSFAENSFDVVTAINVMEHLTNPLVFMESVNRLLKPDGLLMFKTVAIDSRLACKRGAYWDHLKWPGHLIWYTQQSLAVLSKQTGYSICKKRITGIPYIPGIKTYIDEKKTATESNRGKKDSRQNAKSLIKLGLKAVFRSKILRSMISSVINVFRLGDTVIYIVKKEQ